MRAIKTREANMTRLTLLLLACAFCVCSASARAEEVKSHHLPAEIDTGQKYVTFCSSHNGIGWITFKEYRPFGILVDVMGNESSFRMWAPPNFKIDKSKLAKMDLKLCSNGGLDIFDPTP